MIEYPGYTPDEVLFNRRDIPRWESTVLPSELQTPEQRLQAVLNITQNGAQTLTVLTMGPDTSDWSKHTAINTLMRNRVGTSVVHSKTTFSHLTGTISEVGMAARSTLNDEEWALTDFGVTCKATLIFAWQKFLEIGVDPMVALGINSRSKKDSSGGIITTPPMTRFRVLNTLFQPGNVMGIREVAEKIGLNEKVVAEQVRGLTENGLISHRLYDRNSGQLHRYRISPKGVLTQEWPLFESRHQRWITASQQAYVAVAELSQKEVEITSEAVDRFVNERFRPGKPPTTINPSDILKQWARQHELLERLPGIEGVTAEIEITTTGVEVLNKVLFPLFRWAKDITSVEDITSIAENLKRNPDAYQYFYTTIVESFFSHSPFKNKDKEEKIRRAKRIITERPGELWASELGKELGSSSSTGINITRVLLGRREIELQNAKKGSRQLIFPVPETSN